MLEHGGRLRQAAQRYGIPMDNWLDLSTGIAPYSLPLPPIPQCAWARLPEPDDGLLAAAEAYYRALHLLPVAGSQAAIQALPLLRQPAAQVGILAPCYAEHAAAWERAPLHRWQPLSIEQANYRVAKLDVLVVVNPNNPTGQRIPVAQLLDWHQQLARHGGWLIVDEAFMDCTPEQSLAAYSSQPGLIVLRSFGKFFGLAGARLGFVLAEPYLLERLNEHLGPWTIAGPSRWVAIAQLQDRAGQQRQRERLQQDSQRLITLLERYELAPTGGCTLFQWLCHPQAGKLYNRLTHQGILLRHYPQPRSLRVGLPPDETGWQRLEQALAGWLGT